MTTQTPATPTTTAAPMGWELARVAQEAGVARGIWYTPIRVAGPHPLDCYSWEGADGRVATTTIGLQELLAAATAR